MKDKMDIITNKLKRKYKDWEMRITCYPNHIHASLIILTNGLPDEYKFEVDSFNSLADKIDKFCKEPK
jgi:hypothetical protein